MKYTIDHKLLEDGFWQSILSVHDQNNFHVATLVIDSVNRIHSNVLLEFKRHIETIVDAANTAVE